MIDREPAPEQGGRFFRQIGAAAAAAGKALVGEFIHDMKSGLDEWVNPSETGQAPGEDTRPFSRTIGKMARDGAERPPEEEIGDHAWKGPEGKIGHSQLDEVVAEAIRHGGRIPETVVMNPHVKAVALSTLALLGFPNEVTRYGSSTDARREAGLTGPKTGTSKQDLVWLASEGSTAISLLMSKSAAALAVAGAIFEHKYPNTLFRRGVTLGQRLVGRAPDESEPVKNDDEASLLDVANALLLDVFGVDNQGQSQERIAPGSVEPLLLAIAVELAGKREVGPELAAALVRRYKASWENNRVHRASYPPDLEDLYRRIMGVEFRLRNEARAQAMDVVAQQPKSKRKRLDFQKIVTIITNNLRLSYETPLLADAASLYAKARAARLTGQRTLLKSQAEDRWTKQVEHDRSVRETRKAAKMFSKDVLADPYAVAEAGWKAAEDRDSAGLLRSTMALYEQLRVGVDGAASEFSELLDVCLDTMLDHVYDRSEKIAAGYVRPEEAVFISLFDVHDKTQWVRKTKILAIQKALEKSTFTEKTILSNTGEEGPFDPPTKESYHPDLYESNVREVRAAVKACRVTEVAMTGMNWSELKLDESQLERLNCLAVDRKLRAIEKVDALEKAIGRKLNAQEKMGLERELAILKQWRKYVKEMGPSRVSPIAEAPREGPSRGNVSDASPVGRARAVPSPRGELADLPRQNQDSSR